jgi:hypothetical protein
MYLGPTPAVNVTTPSATQTMPLVVPGLMSSGKDKNDDWAQKLMGKKIGDSSDEVVRSLNILPRIAFSQPCSQPVMLTNTP